MEKVRFRDITINLDNMRKPLNSIDREKISKQKLYPYCGANAIMDYVDEYIFDEEILCIAEDGGKWGKNEDCSYIMKEKCWVNNHAHVIKVTDKVDIRYLKYWLNYNDLNSQITGAIVRKLTQKALNELEILIPEKKEQIYICNTLDKVKEIIDIRKKQIEKLDELIKSQFVEMFENNKDVKNKKIVDICSSIIRGPFGSALKKEFFVEKSENTYKVYEQKNAIKGDWRVGTYYIDEKKFNELKRFECKAKDIIMSCSGTIGRFYQLPDDIDKGIINQALLKFTINEEIVLSQYFIDYMKMNLNSLDTKGSGLQNIGSVSYIKEMEIPIPKIELQIKYLNFVKQIDKQKVEIQKSLEEVQKLQESLMNKYFGG